MKKIVSKYKRKKSDRRKQIIVSVILIGILFVSTVGFAFQGSDTSSDEQESIESNGIEFIEQSGYWVAEINQAVFIFRYNPEQIQETNPSLNLLDNYYNKVLYLNSNTSEAELELFANMGQFVTRIQRACLEGEECLYEDVPIKTCEDNFIIIEQAEEKEIIPNQNCVYIRGPEQELTQLTDEFLFNIFNII
jgi:hypothetical protein